MDKKYFLDSGFYKTFKNCFDIIKNFNKENLSIENVQIFTRLKKIFSQMDTYFENLDGDLIAQGPFLETGKNLENSFTSVIEILKKDMQDPSDWQRINSTLEDILVFLKRMSIHLTLFNFLEKKECENLYREKNEVLDEFIKKINSASFYKKIKKIDEFHEKLLEDESTFEEKKRKIDQYYEELLNGSEQEKSIKIQIENEREEILRKVKEIEEKIENSSTKQDELNEFYIKIFGTKNKNNELEGGLEQQIDTDRKNIETYKTEQETIIEAIKEKIESLLPNATSVGLAKAFGDETRKLKKSVRWWTAGFIIPLIALIFFNFYLEGISLTPIEGWVFRISTSGVLVWLAYFSGVRRSETNRFYHEYLHKEVIANSFSSYKKQIEELNETDKSLLSELLKRTVEDITKNPSTVLDKSHNASLPIKEEVLKGNG